MKAYWWRHSIENFGDELGPRIVEMFTGTRVEWAPPAAADIVLCGSVLSHLPDGWAGTVLTAGLIASDARMPDLSHARVLAVRGAKTRRRLHDGAHDVVLGDLAILASLLDVEHEPVNLGIVPHYADRALAKQHPGRLIIDVTDDPCEVVRKIARCRRVIGSSLHALVVADAFGIPHTWAPCNQVIGGRFKFDDYVSAFGETRIAKPGKWRTSPRAAMAVRQAELRALLEGL